MMDGLITFDGLPKGDIYAGQEIDVQVSLFGRSPSQPYHVRVGNRSEITHRPPECEFMRRVANGS